MARVSNVNDPKTPWWRHAAVYQIYVRSFADSNGDGIGDLPGITARLPYVKSLGVDAIWLTPFYTSPQHDHGYDVADYRDVDRLFGTLEDADRLIARAHGLGLKVIVDLVPNHTSWDHAWFRAALAAGPGSPERARYLFRTGRGEHGELPPNNWESIFGGRAWTRVGDTDQWYLHLFDASQPDLDWRSPEVNATFHEVLRFWLDRGVEGFRIDVAHGLLKEESLRDQVHAPRTDSTDHDEAFQIAEHEKDEPMWDQPEVHDVYRSWHPILAEYDAMAVAEAWTRSPERTAAYVRADELQQTFNFAWLLADWDAAAYHQVIATTIEAHRKVGAWPTWVLDNHDVTRSATRYGGGATGLARSRAATLATLALPGAAYLYQGEELGLPEVDVAPADRQDPAWFRTGKPGRDGCRVPIPWGGSAPPYAFGPGPGAPWIPQPHDWGRLTVERQQGDPASTLEFHRQALALRRTFAHDDAAPEVELLDLGPTVLAFRSGGVTTVVNCGATSVRLPEGEVLLASGPTEGRRLPPDTGAWLRG
jgi:alpha-glucosidase